MEKELLLQTSELQYRSSEKVEMRYKYRIEEWRNSQAHLGWCSCTGLLVL